MTAGKPLRTWPTACGSRDPSCAAGGHVLSCCDSDELAPVDREDDDSGGEPVLQPDTVTIAAHSSAPAFAARPRHLTNNVEHACYRGRTHPPRT